MQLTGVDEALVRQAAACVELARKEGAERAAEGHGAAGRRELRDALSHL